MEQTAAVATEAPNPAPHQPRGKSAPVLSEERHGLSESKRQDWVVDVPINHTLKDCLDPSYWALVAYKMEPLDHIELRAEDGSWVAFVIVHFCERTYARVVLDRVIKLDGEKDAPEGSIRNRVEWKGTQVRYAVIRNSDDKVLQHGFRAKADAQKWLIDYEKNNER